MGLAVGDLRGVRRVGAGEGRQGREGAGADCRARAVDGKGIGARAVFRPGRRTGSRPSPRPPAGWPTPGQTTMENFLVSLFGNPTV